jgi:RHS repeat-associated protein
VDQNGNVLSRYAATQNTDELLAELRSATTSYYSQDGLGSVTSLTTSAGALGNTYTYDSFGKLSGSTGSIANRFQYTAREYDSETGLYSYRARYYDPSTARFLSEDPTGFGAGVDFYSYVSNRPVQLTDPTGLSAADVQRILAACKKCTDKLTSQGLRSPGSGRRNGYWNDLSYWFTKRESCYGQALLTQPCLENPVIPYDDTWTFEVTPIEWGTHRVVVGRDSNPSDPVVFCDPWRNTSWTTPKPPATTTGGGEGW